MFIDLEQKQSREIRGTSIKLIKMIFKRKIPIRKRRTFTEDVLRPMIPHRIHFSPSSTIDCTKNIKRVNALLVSIKWKNSNRWESIWRRDRNRVARSSECTGKIPIFSFFSDLPNSEVFHVKEVGTRFDNICPDSPNDLCCRSSRLCWIENLILNRMVVFSEGVIGQKAWVCLEKLIFHVKKASTRFAWRLVLPF